MRGSFIQVGGNFSSGFFVPVNQMQILLHFSALVAVLERLFGLMFHFAERVARVADDVRDGFHHFFHNAFQFGYGALQRLKPSLLLAWSPTALHAPFMRPNRAFVIQNF
jgi:hypothetical protein